MAAVWIKAESYQDHPLFLRERGMHLPWYRRGRIPLYWGLPGGLFLNGLAVASRIYPRAFNWLDAGVAVFAGSFLYWGIRRARIGGRVLDLRRSGFIRELELLGRSGMDTAACFVRGNRAALWEYLFLTSPAFWLVSSPYGKGLVLAPVLVLALLILITVQSGGEDGFWFRPAGTMSVLRIHKPSDIYLEPLVSRSVLYLFPGLLLGFAVQMVMARGGVVSSWPFLAIGFATVGGMVILLRILPSKEAWSPERIVEDLLRDETREKRG